MTEAVIVDGLRTPIGRHRGGLSGVRPDDLAARTIEALIERQPAAKEAVEEVFFGDTNQAGEDNRNVARMASLLAGLPYEVPGVTVNRLCGSGLEAVIQASRGVRLGDYDVLHQKAEVRKHLGYLPQTFGFVADVVHIELHRVHCDYEGLKAWFN